MIRFTVYGTAEPAGSKRAFVVGGKARVTDANRKSAPWKQEVASQGAEAMERDGHLMLGGPLAVRFSIYVPRPAGHFGKKGLLPSARVFPTVKPDLLKLARGLEDALTGICWRDDAQIVTEHLFKLYGEPARVEVQIREILPSEYQSASAPETPAALAIPPPPQSERITP